MERTTVGPVLDGRELKDGGGGHFDVVNPATGEVVAQEACCDEATVSRIAESADAAFRSDAWQNLSPADRGKLVWRIADLLEERAEAFVQLELADVGKPVSALRGGEIPLAASILRFYAGAADKVEGAVKSAGGGAVAMTLWEPYGAVAGVLPWNYPLVNAAMKVGPALAAGNAIVLKPSVETPLTTPPFALLCAEAGAPPGIVNVATGSGGSAGSALVAHPAIKKISFTGSTAVGQRIQREAATQMKAVNLELGGKNALIAFEDADLERAAQAAVLSAFSNCGQLCVSCSRLLVQRSVSEDMVAMLCELLAKLPVGDPNDPETLVGPMITRAQYETALEYMDVARSEGCGATWGGGKLKMPAPFDKGFWLEPTLLVGVEPGMRVHDEEIFGPVLSVVEFDDEDEAVRIANSVEYGLSGSVWTGDGERALRVMRKLDTGIVWVNTMLTGYPQICVPPHKMSGTGVELGMEGLLAFCKRKSAMVNFDDKAPVGWGL